MADLWNTDDTDSTDKHRFLCIRLFPADLEEKRRILISEDQGYPCLPQASAGEFYLR
jgi:hypothetical protein